jgi:hypothetical protein
VLALGCAATPSATSTEPSAPATSGTELVAEAPDGKRAAPPDVTGEWVEFWALSGGADTQRYVFTSDGHFEWHAATSQTEPVVARFGTFAASGMFLDLAVRFEQASGACTTGCRTAVEPARIEQIALAECPPNEEARALDASYRCLSFGDRAFWHR